MKIDFVITHNSYPNLKKTLESVRRNTLPENIGKVILIDQNPIYQQVDYLVDLHIFTNGKNLGFAKGMNTGIRLSDANFIACWNDDCECINPKWVSGIEETFKRVSNAVGVNPSSPRNPGSPGGGAVDEWEYKENFSDDEYDKLVKEMGKGWMMDGICTYATVYDREKLDKVKGCIPGKCWYDEAFYPGGGEDYCMNVRAYKSGYRMLGTGLSFVWHWWYGTGNKCHFSNKFNEKYGNGVDIFGNNFLGEIPNNIIMDI